MKIELIAFSEKGFLLAQKIGHILEPDNAVSASRCGLGAEFSLAEWTGMHFDCADALIFVGAAGICVRAISPYVKSKITDPAIIVVDECATFSIPILSGHIGGANLLAKSIAKAIGATAVITTATDCNNLFAVDSYAVQSGFKIENTGQIKNVSAKIISGNKARISSDFQIDGDLPSELEKGCDADCDIKISTKCCDKLLLVPPILTLGIGCKRGTSAAAIEAEFSHLLDVEKLVRGAFYCACSIDLKKDEQGLIEFCKANKLKIKFFTAQELMSVCGDFEPSQFVLNVTGADNVCERAAAHNGGKIIVKRQANNGITLAVAIDDFVVKF